MLLEVIVQIYYFSDALMKRIQALEEKRKSQGETQDQEVIKTLENRFNGRKNEEPNEDS